jgi:predicted TIM-barrel fold metal-dependent hydrolase
MCQRGLLGPWRLESGARRSLTSQRMWGSDYPHPDGVWPESTKYVEEQFAGLSPEVIHKITCENAAKFTGLID